MFGAPSEIVFIEEGEEVWNYESVVAELGGISYVPIIGLFAGMPTHSETKALEIVFDADGVVKDFSMKETDMQARFGISKIEEKGINESSPTDEESSTETP